MLSSPFLSGCNISIPFLTRSLMDGSTGEPRQSAPLRAEALSLDTPTLHLCSSLLSRLLQIVACETMTLGHECWMAAHVTNWLSR